LVESRLRAELHFDLSCVKELGVKCFLGLDGTPDVVRVKSNPDAPFTRSLVNLNLHNLAEISAANLNLVFNVNEETCVFFQIDFFQVEHVRKHQTVRWVVLRKRSNLFLLDRLWLWWSQIANIFVTHELLHKLSTGLARIDV
jgi:hypothetical protein